jgi:hypothetical protein
MTWEEYNKLFHKEQLNLVAFKRLMDCDEEVLRLVNSAIKAEREAVANWIMGKGFATGHGDDIVDMLDELEWQVAEREREREACAECGADGGHALYCVACAEKFVKNEWVGLTDEDIQKLAAEHHDWESLYFAVQAKLKEKNT